MMSTTTALADLCATRRREIAELEELVDEHQVNLDPALRTYLESSEAFVAAVTKALADRDNPKRRKRARATFLPELSSDDDGAGAGKLLIVVTADALGSALVTDVNEIGETGRPGSERRVMSPPLALVTETELRTIRIKDRRRVFVLQKGWQDKLYDALVAAGARYAYETTTAAIRACASERILRRWFDGTRDERFRATLRDQLQRITPRRARLEAAE